MPSASVIRDLNDGVAPDYAFESDMHGVVAAQDATGEWVLNAASTAEKRAALRGIIADHTGPSCTGS